jgi:hypothetical protein
MATHAGGDAERFRPGIRRQRPDQNVENIAIELEAVPQPQLFRNFSQLPEARNVKAEGLTIRRAILNEQENDPGPRCARSPQRQKPSWWDRLQDSWIAEISACTSAVILFGLQCGLLAWSDGRPISHWDHSFQLNSVIALLDTTMTASLTFVLSSCLGQLKWTWFKGQKERLVWLDRLAHASTIVGAMQLIFYLAPKRIWRYDECCPCHQESAR